MLILVIVGLLVAGCSGTADNEPATTPATTTTATVATPQTSPEALDRLAAAVESGRITQEQADQLRQRMEESGGLPGTMERGMGQPGQGSAEGSAIPRGPRPFAQPPQSAQPTSQLPIVIGWEEAKDHVGEEVTVCGPVMSTYYDSVSRDRPTYFHIGNPFPDPDRVVVIISGRDRTRFPQPPEVYYSGKDICVTGTILQDEGIPWIALQSRTKIEEQ